VFGTGQVTIPQMCKAGFLLNLIGVAIVVGFAYIALPRILISTHP
jgi:di/tricarboxylate transporter